MIGGFVILGLLVITLIDYAIFHQDSSRWEWFNKQSKASRIGILLSVFGGMLLVNFLVNV